MDSYTDVVSPTTMEVKLHWKDGTTTLHICNHLELNYETRELKLWGWQIVGDLAIPMSYTDRNHGLYHLDQFRGVEWETAGGRHCISGD